MRPKSRAVKARTKNGHSKRVGSGEGSAGKHPQHLAREIRGLMTGNFTAWSIYPDQLPAMERRLTKTILAEFAVSNPKAMNEWAAGIAKACLKSIGLSLPNSAICHGRAQP